MVDPNDFIIVRKRKKYRFAKFANSPICYEYEEWVEAKAQDGFVQPDVFEVGAGNGLFSVEMAARNPEKQFIALDIKGDRLQHGAYVAAERGITNIRFVRARADQITELCDDQSLAEVWVTFPDPFPRKRSSGRRLTHPHFLALYRQLLKADGSLFLKHDNRDFFHWSLEQLVADKWRIVELSFDLHNSELDDRYKILTTYEIRWLNEGLVTNFVQAKVS